MGARILVADDEEALVRALTYALEREGYEVDSVSTAPTLSRARARACTTLPSSTS